MFALHLTIAWRKFSRKILNDNLNPNPKDITPSLCREGWGWVSHDTLMTPLTPFRGGCKPSVYRHYDTLTPLNIKFSRARARNRMWQDKSGHCAPRSNVNGFQCSRAFALLLTPQQRSAVTEKNSATATEGKNYLILRTIIRVNTLLPKNHGRSTYFVSFLLPL